MNFDSYLPADCQGNNKSFPWNHADLGEPESKGSDCCEANVKEVDGVIICCSCGEACEEVFESEEELQERIQDEEEWREADLAESRFEAERDERYC